MVPLIRAGEPRPHKAGPGVRCRGHAYIAGIARISTTP